MKKTLQYLCLFFTFAISFVHAIDSMEFRESYLNFKYYSGLEPTVTNYKKILQEDGKKEDSETYICAAITLLAASIEVSLEEKKKLILNCVERLGENIFILYEAARALRPGEESVKLYLRITDDKEIRDYDTMKFLSLVSLLEQGVIPDNAFEIFLGQFQGISETKNVGDDLLALRVRHLKKITNPLKNIPSDSAKELLSRMNALFVEQNIDINTSEEAIVKKLQNAKIPINSNQNNPEESTAEKIKNAVKSSATPELDFQKAIDVFASSIVDKKMDIAISVRVKTRDFFDRNSAKEKNLLPILKSIENGHWKQYFMSIYNIKTHPNQYCIYPTRIRTSGKAYVETGKPTFRLDENFAWLMIYQGEKRFGSDILIIDFPDKNNGVFKCVEDNRLQVDIPLFFVDLKAIYLATECFSPELMDVLLPLLNCNLSCKILEEVVQLKSKQENETAVTIHSAKEIAETAAKIMKQAQSLKIEIPAQTEPSDSP